MSRITLADFTILVDPEQFQYQRFPTNLTLALLRTNGFTTAYLDRGIALRNISLAPKYYELVILRVIACTPITEQLS